jgi:hypothetical protein
MSDRYVSGSKDLILIRLWVIDDVDKMLSRATDLGGRLSEVKHTLHSLLYAQTNAATFCKSFGTKYRIL